MKTRTSVYGASRSKIVFRVGSKLDISVKKKGRPTGFLPSPNVQASLTSFAQRRTAKKKKHRDILWRKLSSSISEYKRLRGLYPTPAAEAYWKATWIITELIASGLAAAEDPRIVEAKTVLGIEPP
jgi:hypothetical protein